jgi:hypothetical protein
MFRFTIRDVLWLTVVVALGFAVFLANTQIVELRKYKEAVERSGYYVGWNIEGPYLIIAPETERSN